MILTILTFKLFTLFYFISLCDSIDLFFLSRIRNKMYSKLITECDYYIDKKLHVYYNDNSSIIILNREKCFYYYPPLDNDYEYQYNNEVINKYLNKQLEVNTKEITIYSNNSFNKSSFENKYKKLVENDLNNNHRKWGDIIEIRHIEDRCKNRELN